MIPWPTQTPRFQRNTGSIYRFGFELSALAIWIVDFVVLQQFEIGVGRYEPNKIAFILLAQEKENILLLLASDLKYTDELLSQREPLDEVVAIVTASHV